MSVAKKVFCRTTTASKKRNVEEERRLMYVGITRAKRQLTLTHCVKRKNKAYGSSRTQPIHRRNAAGRFENPGRKGGEPIVSKEEGRRNLADIIGRPDSMKKGGPED